MVFEKTEEQKNMFFFERQNSSGGLRPPQQSIIQTLLLVMKICIRLDAAETGDLRYYIKNHPTLTDVRIGRTGDVLCFYFNITKLQIDRIYFSFMLCAK